MEALAQALVEALREAGAARLIATFAVAPNEEGEDVQELGPVELYKANDNAVGGYSIDPHEVNEEKLAAITEATTALVACRYAGKVASGKLLVDESDRVWGEGVHEQEPAAAAGLRVEL